MMFFFVFNGYLKNYNVMLKTVKKTNPAQMPYNLEVV